ncbi:MAG TPA: DUF1800 domain-containing protein [Gemmatimonadales bacterium]
MPRPGLTLIIGIALAAPLPAQAPMTAVDSARHALDRLAYGATPGQIDAIARGGVMKWVDDQLAMPDLHDPSLRPVEAQADVLRFSAADLDQMLQNNQKRAAAAKAEPDSSRRQQMLDDIRRDQVGSRRDLGRLDNEIPALTVARAVQSDRQLGEILADFWTNHFNVYINKGQDRAYFADYLEHSIRDHALGRFEDLLIATAESPAMLFYLDNAQSVADDTGQRRAALLAAAQQRNGARRGLKFAPRAGTFQAELMADSTRLANQSATAARAPRGLNENYARELMELHTLGVDGGYSQQDVITVARILTGWSIDRASGTFLFRAPAHDAGAKLLFGQTFPAGHGQDEGIRLLRLLANAPATIHHVSAELCARFVADVPPDGCIDDAVRAWTQSHGEIRAVMHAIVHSPDFWASANVENKVKTPLEFVASALRAVNGTSDSTPRVAQRVGQLGEPLFQHQTPDGYGEREEDWVNSGALLARMNFAVQLASGRMPGTMVDLDHVVDATTDHPALVTAINQAILGGAMTDHTRTTILKEIADVPDPRMARALAVGLALGGPEFQKQ